MTDTLPMRADALRSGGVDSRSGKSRLAHEVAQKLESTFLAEMLKSAGLGAREGSFGGGVGEDQFASFQRQALADSMVRAGGIGLAEHFYQALLEKSNEKSSAN